MRPGYLQEPLWVGAVVTVYLGRPQRDGRGRQRCLSRLYHGGHTRQPGDAVPAVGVRLRGRKVINASIWDNDGVKPSVFTTCTPEMTAAKQDAIEAALVAGVVINDDNMSDCGLGAF